MLGPAVGCLFSIIYPFFLEEKISITARSVLVIFSDLFAYLGIYVPLAALWAKLSKHFVDGFETTGVAIVVGLFDLGQTLNYLVGDFLINQFDVKKGYLERVRGPLVCFVCIQIVLTLISVAFFYHKEPKIKGIKFD